MFERCNHRRFLMWAMVAGGIVVFGWVGFCLLSRPAVAPHELLSAGASPPALSSEAEARIEAFCADCHALPRPESFPRARWHFEVRKGYEFYAKSGLKDLDPPPVSMTLAYFLARAPDRLTVSRGEEASGELPLKFRKESLSLDSGLGVLPEIAHLYWARLAPDEEPLLLASDMRYGHVFAIDLSLEQREPPRVLARLRNPARFEVCDTNGDGALDLVVADLGSYLPADHDRGRVVLLQSHPEVGTYQQIELATGLGRVADVRAADVDRDGKLDLVVAEFGWHETGGIRLLRNISSPSESPRFVSEVIDDRPGAIHVPVFDFNGDGRPDIAALVSQEYESVDVFLNTGKARFARHNLWAAPDLTFGSTGIDLVDLNQDGNVDILYTNGDAFDNSWVSPWHGVQWLENSGGGKFDHHRLTDMPGAYRALAADFDQDGDQDIIVTALLPLEAQPSTLHGSPLASIVFLEQTEIGVFARHTLEWNSPWYATLAIGDFDSDGDPDFAVGTGPMVAKGQLDAQALTVRWNETVRN